MNPMWRSVIAGVVAGGFGLGLSAQDQDKDKKPDAKLVVAGTAVSPPAAARPDETIKVVGLRRKIVL